MCKQLSINQSLLRFSKRLAFLLVMLGSFYANGQSSTTAKWTDAINHRNANFYQLQDDFNKYWAGRKIEKGKGYKVFKRWEADMAPRVYPSGDLALPTYENYISWQQSNPQNRGGGSAAVASTGNWTALGPVGKPGGCVQCTGAGRVNFVRFDPTNSNTMFVGAPDGGLWKSTNAGTSWTTNTDFLATIGCSDLAIDPTNTNIMYLATGDIEGDKNSIGVLKTTNGGTTWNATGLTFTASNFTRICKILMNPTNPLNLLVATNAAIYRSTDGGASFSMSHCCNVFKDMEFKPGDPNTVYASGSTFWKSTDNGVTWAQVTTGLPAANVERIALGVSAGNSAYVYALIGSSIDNGFLGLYRSTNSGASFTLRSSSPNLLGWDTDGLDAGGQAFYDLSIAVNPTNAEIVTTGGVNQWQSTNGGTSWTIKSYWFGGGVNPPFVHADVHEINYLPGSGSTFFSCNDGGIFKTTNDGATWTDISNNLNISQETKIGLSANDPALYVIGTQDNGTSKHAGTTWTNIYGGDGGECFIDRTNNNTVYASYVFAEWLRSTNGGTTMTTITNGLPGGNTADFYSTWHQDPVTSTTLYSGGYPALYKSTNQGTNWSLMGTPTGSGNIVDFAIAPSSPTTIYAIKFNSISKSTNGGASFVNITGTLPVASAAITNLCVSNTNPLKVWVTFSGYSAGNKVFKSINGGTSWTNVSTGLPNIPMNTIVYKNGSANDEVYIGGDVGVYYLDNTLASWAVFNTNLPNVSIRDLEIYYPTGKLRAGTYGRGTWESDLNVPTAVCGTPTSLSASAVTQTTATLNWSAVASATSYNMQIRVSPAGAWTTLTSATNSISIINLVANTAYDFQVQAVCAAPGTYSSIATFTTLATACGTPTSLSASAVTQTTATLNWSAVASATSYNMQIRVSPAGAWTTLTSATNSISIINLIANTAYDFQVQAVCAAPGTYSSIATFTTLATACGTPVSLTATSITQTTATLNWSAVASATSYNIQYRISPAGTWILTTSATNSKAISGLTANTAYNFRVQAVCAATGTYSAIANFSTTATACGTPVSLSATSITQTTATLNWGAVASATSYNIQYRISPAGTWILTTSATNSKAISGLTANTAYNFRVQAVCAATGTYSSIANFSTTATGCGTPVSLSATSITQTTATLNWGAVASATSYNIQYRLSPAGAWTTTTSATTSKAISALTANTAYDFHVQAVCATVGAYSSTATFTTLPTTTGCGVPAIVSVTSITPTKATVNCGAVAGATKYNVSYRVSGTTAWLSKTVTVTGVNLTGLFSGTVYNFRVRAFCTVWGSYSAIQNFTTSPLPTACNNTDYYEPNNTLTTPAAIAPNTNVYPLISSATDKDFFKVTTTTAAPKIKIDLDGLPFDYDVNLYLSSSGALLGSSANGSTTAEQIIYNAGTTGTIYKVQVFGYNGAFSTSQCYHLRVSTSAANFREMGPGVEQNETSDFMSLYPNPANDQLTIDLLSDKYQTAIINLVDMLGRSVLNIKKDISEGQNNVRVDLSSVQQGIYTVRVNVNGKNLVQKLVIEK